MASPDVVRFGIFELDYGSGELRSNGKRVALQSQPAQVLWQLVSNPGQVVTREELRRAVWADDTFVEFDTALNVAVNKSSIPRLPRTRSPRNSPGSSWPGAIRASRRTSVMRCRSPVEGPPRPRPVRQAPAGPAAGGVNVARAAYDVGSHVQG